MLRKEARGFSETVSRAVDLESISRSIRSRRNTRTATVRVAQETATSSLPQYLNDLTKQLKGLMVTTKDLTTAMTQFVLTSEEQFLRPSNGTEEFKLARAGTPLNERVTPAVFRTTTEPMEARNVSEMGTVKIKLVGIENTAELDVSMTENAISFKTL